MHSFSDSKHSTLKYILCYTLLFCLCAALCLGCFVTAGKSLAWSGSEGQQDGISQHYIALSYWGDYLRTIARTLLTEGKLSIPTFDTTIGLGGDVIQTLSYYVVGDPLTLLSALVPRAYTEYLYDFLIILRLYLAGLSFSALALHLKKNNRFYTLIGAMIYVFSSYVTYFGTRHPYFINPLIYLPLIILGAEYIFKKRKPWIFMLSIALAAVSNFYFFYMIVIVTVLYVAVRMFDFLPRIHPKEIFRQLAPFVCYAAVGVLMGCVLFYPSVMTLLGSNRTTSTAVVELFYPLKNYINMFFTLGSTFALRNEALIGHLPLVFPAIFLLWRRKGHRTLKILLTICLIFLIFPFFGYLLNGMSYVTNRWTWALSLVLSLICTLCLPELASTGAKALLGLLSFISVFCLYGILLQGKSESQYISMFVILLSVAVPALLCVFFSEKRYYGKLLKSAVLILTLVSVSTMSHTRFVASGYVYRFTDRGECLDTIRSAQGNALNTLKNTSFYRYEDYTGDARCVPRNATLLNGGNSTNCFFSLSSPAWYELLRSVGYRHPLEQDVQGTDNRTIIGMLSNIKYFTGEQEKQNGFLPYGYNNEAVMTHWVRNPVLNRPWPAASTPKHLLYGYYENKLALPFGYTYDSYITREEYDKLSFNERQTALLHAAVLEKDADLLAKAKIPEGTEHIVNYTLQTSKHLSKRGNYYVATKGNQYLTLTLKNPLPERETYLTMYNATFLQQDPYTQAKENGKLATLSKKEIDALKESAYHFKQNGSVLLTARMNEATKNIRFYSSDSPYNSGIRDVCTNLGYAQTAPTEIRLRFNSPGIYTLEGLEVSQLDLSECKEQAKALSAEHLQNVVFSDNLITGDINLSSDKLLCLSLPYSKGWSAFVDGKETPIKKTSLAFLGIELSKGNHQIELRYQTPYLKGGIILSCLGWLTFALLLLMAHLRRRKKSHLCVND